MNENFDMKKSIIIVGLFIISGSSFATELMLRDSVGVERINGQSYIIHQVDEKETLFGISRRYKTPVNEIVQNNDGLKEGLKIGQRIRVPFVEKSAVPAGAKLHNVAPGETMFSIARTYQVSVNDLMSWNALKGNDLSVGQALIIQGVADKPTEPVAEAPKAVEPSKAPSTKPEAAPSKKPAEQKPMATTQPSTTMTSGGWITHQVAQGQTLFSIAKQYEAKVEDLIEWNGLSSNNLSLGQSLKVGRDKTSSVPTVTSPVTSSRTEERAPVTSGPAPTASAESTTSSSTAYKNIKEVGQAEVIEGTGNHKKYLVLHRSAPVGTIMRIRNEENDITVFARVVGVLPNTGDNNKLIIKVSKAAYDQLRAVNSRFPVEVSY